MAYASISAGARLAIVNNSKETFTPTHSGAIATCVWEVLRCATADGVTADVITLPHEAAPYDYPSISFVRPEARRGAFARRATRVLRRLRGWAHVDQGRYAADAIAHLRRLRATVAVCSNDPEVAVAIRRALPHVTVVHWFHNLMVPTDRFRRAYAADPDIVSVAVSAYIARGIEQVYQMTPRTIAVALNGVDLDRFSPTAAMDRGAVPTIGFLGRIAVEKGADLLLRAAILLARQGHTFRVQIAGDTNWGYSSPGQYRSEVYALVDELREHGIAVDLTGHVGRADVPDALRTTDIHVVPSRWDEPCALTILEGLATGRAVVGSATGGTPELIVDSGALFARENAADLARVLGELLEQPERRASLQRAARARAESLPWSRTWAALSSASGLGTTAAA